MKKLIIILTICGMILSFSSGVMADEEIPPLTGDEGVEDWFDIIPGDIDLDGKVTPVDSNIISRHFTGLINFNEDQKIAADLNEDGNINAIDSNLLKRRLVGLS